MKILSWLFGEHAPKTDPVVPELPPSPDVQAIVFPVKLEVKRLIAEGYSLHDAEMTAHMDYLAKGVEGDWFPSKLAGVGFPNDDGSDRQSFIAMLRNKEELTLVPEPDSKYDKYAIRVLNQAGQQVGYLGSRVAEQVSRGLAKGQRWECFVSEVTGLGKEKLGVNVAMLRYEG